MTQQIYEAFLAKAHLTDEHRQELRKKRGFTDETIDRFRFVSGGPYVKKILDELKGKFERQALVEAGLFQEANQTVIPSGQILEDRIIIPYIDEAGNATLIRPHKLGFKDVGIQPYCRMLLAGKPEHIVLTEGEFKAVALAQWNIPALAIPGIQSHAGKHFERLCSLLKEFEVQRITVIFDNEIKDDPKLPNYKERPEDRWDTPYWAYVMAAKLKKAGFDVNIGWLPDAWRKNGKVDFDSALAAGKTREDILAVIERAVVPSEFLDSLLPEAQRIVRRKIAQYFMRSPVRREFNRYVIERVRGDGSARLEEVISNFVIDIKASFFSPEGCMRHVKFTNEFGEESEVFVLEPADMAGVGEFKKFCFGRGNYVFQGSGADLTEIWKYELLRDTGDMIYTPEQIGEIRPGFWLFANVAVKNGKVYQPDSDGIFWIDGAGYKPRSLSVGLKGEIAEDSIPSLYTGSIDILKVAETLKASVGGYQAYMGLGWVVATIFSREIFKVYKAFPFPFVHGKRESGKSTFMRWLMAFFGVETEGANIAESTQNYIMRVLGYYSSLGIWFDEYRNEQRITQKDGYLRSAFNRQLSGKGVKEAFGAKSYSVHGTIALSGEELPRDNGLFTRCVPLQISAYGREREHYDKLNRGMERFSGFTFWLITHYDELKDRVLKTIRELKEALVQCDITDRAAENWAILAGAFHAVIKEDPDFIKWVLKACQEVKRIAEEEHMLNQFWNDVAILEADGELGPAHFALKDDKLAIWFPAVYNAWAEQYRRRTGKEPFDRTSILKYLQDEPYYAGTIGGVRLKGGKRWCHLISPENAPEPVKELIDHIKWQEQTGTNDYR